MRFPRRIHLSIPHAAGTELDLVREAFDSNWLSTVGPHLEALERSVTDLLGQPVAALASGTAALHLAMRLVGVQPGDEVVVPALTFVASANAVRYQGGVPVFMDCERRTWGLDPVLLEEWLADRARKGRLPRAVIVTHLFGSVGEVAALGAACRRHGVSLVEDAASAIGARRQGRMAGTFGDLGIYSLGGNKLVTATCGGLLTSPRADWIARARHWATQAREPDLEGLHNYIHHELGHNYRLSNVLAGIARGQLEVLETRVAQRRAVFERYAAAFRDLPGFEAQPDLAPEPGSERSEGGALPSERHTRWLSCFLVDPSRGGPDSAALLRGLEAANVEARPVWRPMHRQELYAGCACVGGSVAEDLHRRGICLPSSSCLTTEEQDFVIDVVRALARGTGTTGSGGCR